MTAPLTDQQLAAMQAELDKPGPHHFARADVAAALAEITRLRAELEQARAQVRAVEQVRCWTNEDGKRFVFADDLLTAVQLANPGHQPHCAAATQGCCSCEEPAPACSCAAETVHQAGCDAGTEADQ